MTKNPFVNAVAATIYIAVVASIMFYGPQNGKPVNSVLGPIAFISLFSLSAAFMGYAFLYWPVQLYLDGKKKEAVSLFSRTLFTFAAITVVILILFFSGVLK